MVPKSGHRLLLKRAAKSATASVAVSDTNDVVKAAIVPANTVGAGGESTDQEVSCHLLIYKDAFCAQKILFKYNYVVLRVC